MRLAATKRWWQHVCRCRVTILVCVPIGRVLTERAREQGAGNAADKGCSRPRVVCGSLVPQGSEQVQPGIGMKFFGRRHLGKGRFEGRPTTGSLTPGLGQLDQVSPLVAARTETGEELIDPNGGAVASLRHLIFFLVRETASPHDYPWFFKYCPPRRAPPFRFDQRGLGTLPWATVYKNHRFTDASPRTSWRPPKMACGESAGLANALRVQQTHRPKTPFRFVAGLRAGHLKGGAAVHTRLRHCAACRLCPAEKRSAASGALCKPKALE